MTALPRPTSAEATLPTTDTIQRPSYAYDPPRLAQRVAALNRYLSQDFLGGPKILKLSWVINFQKAGTFAFVGFLMFWYQKTTPAAWVYLALHGTYGFCWLLKHFTFRDPGWEVRITFGGALMSFLLVLGPYWLFPYLLISGHASAGASSPSWAFLAFCIAWHTFGLVLMVGSDCQKFFTLKYKRGLITEGFFRYIRHPNYTGEMMLYSAYAFLVQHWLPWLILAWIWLALFLVNMLNKEASMSRYPEWASYRSRTGMLLPRLAAAPPPEQAESKA